MSCHGNKAKVVFQEEGGSQLLNAAEILSRMKAGICSLNLVTRANCNLRKVVFMEY